MAYPPIAEARRAALLQRQRQSPFFNPGVGIPEWFWRRWHFHPGGYFTEGALTYYEAFIVRLYNYTQERRVHRAVAREIRALGAESVLEIGCGPGRALERLSNWLPGVTLSGVDLAPLMLERAAARLRERDVDLQHLDASVSLDALESPDVLLTMHVPGHVPSEIAEGIVATGSALLKPGGAWIMVEHAWHELPPMPPGFRLQQRLSLLGGLQLLRVYRKAW
jgi:SAM-dependent methyltransferase